jgi:hypothetical protein
MRNSSQAAMAETTASSPANAAPPAFTAASATGIATTATATRFPSSEIRPP